MDIDAMPFIIFFTAKRIKNYIAHYSSYGYYGDI